MTIKGKGVRQTGILRVRGLTLIELMVVIAVIAVIAAIAYPAYTNQMQKTRRADAKAALEMIALAQERFFTINGNYTNDLTLLDVPNEIQAGTSSNLYYTVAAVHPDGDTDRFDAVAQINPAGPQSDDADCAQFTLNNVGERTATDGGGTNCW